MTFFSIFWFDPSLPPLISQPPRSVQLKLFFTGSILSINVFVVLAFYHCSLLRASSIGLNRYSRLVERNWRVKTRMHMWRKMCDASLSLTGLLNSIYFFHFHPFITKFHNLILLYNWIRLCCIFVSHFHHPFISRWTAKLILFLTYCDRVVINLVSL